MSEPLFLIWSIEHNAWWRPERCGYTLRAAEAGRYPVSEANLIVTLANRFAFNECIVPLECVEVDHVAS
jgi:hypothetical protein